MDSQCIKSFESCQQGIINLLNVAQQVRQHVRKILTIVCAPNHPTNHLHQSSPSLIQIKGKEVVHIKPKALLHLVTDRTVILSYVGFHSGARKRSLWFPISLALSSARQKKETDIDSEVHRGTNSS